MTTTSTDVRRRGTTVTILTFVVALLSGDIAMLAVTGFVRKVFGGPAIVQWMIATPIIALGAYFLFGLTQIKAWESGKSKAVATEDIRTKIAVSQLGAGGLLGFVIASLIGGPLATGWWYGRKQDPNARKFVMASAWILALFWSALYLGLLAWI